MDYFISYITDYWCDNWERLMKLSHSAANKYTTCSMMYKLHYKDRLRSNRIGSALFFGSCLDDALNILLLTKKKSLTEEESILVKANPKEAIIESLTNVKINGVVTNIRKSLLVDYYKSDYDNDLLTDDDFDDLIMYAKTIEVVLSCKEDFKGFVRSFQSIKNPTEINEVKLYNYACWLCLKNKALMLFEHYRTEILPKIEEVYSIQKSVSLPDGKDEFIGYIDFIASFVDEPGVKYVVDNKTSSSPYPADSVKTSTQLSAYCEFVGTDKAAYIVLEKKIRKRDPKVRSQIIKDYIPEQQFEETFDNLSEVFYNINEGKFEKNLDSCFQYGKKCPYYDFCRDGSTEGLVDLGSKDANSK